MQTDNILIENTSLCKKYVKLNGIILRICLATKYKTKHLFDFINQFKIELRSQITRLAIISQEPPS